MHLFAVGGDNQVYEQDFDSDDHSASAYYLTAAGRVKSVGLRPYTVGFPDFQAYG
jgi:hypothetical protein